MDASAPGSMSQSPSMMSLSASMSGGLSDRTPDAGLPRPVPNGETGTEAHKHSKKVKIIGHGNGKAKTHFKGVCHFFQ
jgi:hypothetical protein